MYCRFELATVLSVGFFIYILCQIRYVRYLNSADTCEYDPLLFVNVFLSLALKDDLFRCNLPCWIGDDHS